MSDIATLRPAGDYDAFLRELAGFYQDHGRHDMRWRQPATDGSMDPYRILVSEVMLQQTQVLRVTPKYEQFMRRFPGVRELAEAPLGEVLRLWTGLGYNRRARYLWEAARAVQQLPGAAFPDDLAGLRALPGIGPSTAAALLAYAFDRPVVLIETNVRTVLIHHFGSVQSGASGADGDASSVSDRQLAGLLEALLPRLGPSGSGLTPRTFYWALMDYGTHLKKSVGNLNRRSRSYRRQSAFQGSQRQLRGQVIKLLAEAPLSAAQLEAQLADDRLADVLAQLLAEGLVRRTADAYYLA